MSYYAEYTDVVADKHKVPGYRGGFVENFGRFIPCRGGGTATTYYTDVHEVDEDVMTASIQGDMWAEGSNAGVMCRNMWDWLGSGIHIASRLIYLS